MVYLLYFTIITHRIVEINVKRVSSIYSMMLCANRLPMVFNPKNTAKSKEEQTFNDPHYKPDSEKLNLGIYGGMVAQKATIPP